MSSKRDYKTKFDQKNHRKIRLHGLLVILLVLVGMFGALLAYITGDTPYRSGTAPMPTTPSDSEGKASGDSQMPPTVKPKYDFYEVLPERKIVIPREETSQRVIHNPTHVAFQQDASSRTSPAGSVMDEQGYVVQAGSFYNHADADRRKATIAFLGIPAQIEEGIGSDGRVLHRVRIGPLQNMNEVTQMQQRLKENDIQSLAIRIQ